MYLLVVVFFESVTLESYLLELELQLIDLTTVFLVLLLENCDVLFLALARVLGRLPVAFQLLLS